LSRSDKEKELVEFWEKNKTFEKSVDSRPSSKQYVFYDGPPFATGLPHYGHILGLTSKDVFPRFWTMKGFRVERKWGWDCHGLPIENIVEKDLNIQNKRQIEEMGVDTFNETCRSKVLFFADEWKKTVRRMGKWIDFDNSYKTMDDTYMESVWHIFKRLYDEGYIYEGKKVLLYCPRCQTPLSNSEIAMDNSYKDVTEKSLTAKFKVKGEDKTYLLAWTTTPWTLIGNVALAINPDLVYAKVELNGEYLILAKDRISSIKYDVDIVSEMKGEKLLGLEYEPLYSVPSDKKGYYVLSGGNDVSAEEGTGIVHMAIYGEFDYQMIKKYDLPIIQHVGNHGGLTLGPEKWIGIWFKKADAHVIEDLDDRGLLFETINYTHSYPFCYRCETPLFYNAVDSWFVDIQKIKSKLLERNNQINWYPDHLKEGRFKNILETAPDWSISRNRFWATTIPVWKCDDEGCDSISVLGSVDELRKQAIGKVPENVDLHKHVVDKIKLKCNKCGKSMTRIPEVLDCWFESGSMPYAAKHYPFENKEWFKDNFPADFVSEYIAQVRAWFYYMQVLSVVLFDKAPFKNVVVSGTVLAADGSKMSKSKNNFPDPNKLFEEYGADSLRFYLMSSPLMRAQDLNFKEDNVKEIYRKVILLLENVLKFYDLFSEKNSEFNDSSSDNLLDQWIISKVNLLVRDTTTGLEDYDTALVCAKITQFVDELSTWFVRRSRSRFKSEDSVERKHAIRTLAFVLKNIAQVMAPVTPFISEEIHQLLRKDNNSALKESVHLENWPSFDEEKIDEKLHLLMDEVRVIVSKALDEREKVKIPVRQALSKLTIREKNLSLADEYLDIIKDEVNVKEIVIKSEGEELSCELDTNMTEELLQEGIIRDLIRKINGYRKEMNLTVKDRIILFVESSDVLVKKAIVAFSSDLLAQVQADKLFEKVEGVEKKEIVVNKISVVIGIKNI